MKTKNANPNEITTTLWQAIAGTRPGTSTDHRPKPLETEGGRRRFLRLQFRMNEVLTRTDELGQMLRKAPSERRSRLQALIDHQAERAEMFLKRFERMISGDHGTRRSTN